MNAKKQLLCGLLLFGFSSLLFSAQLDLNVEYFDFDTNQELGRKTVTIDDGDAIGPVFETTVVDGAEVRAESPESIIYKIKDAGKDHIGDKEITGIIVKRYPVTGKGVAKSLTDLNPEDKFSKIYPPFTFKEKKDKQTKPADGTGKPGDRTLILVSLKTPKAKK